ncbi:glycosyltransferase family 2 protein [Pseudanabaena sp. 'Roaring Creek']|uniref:glycosyltransferase family 2 protein n=1 Tax=Pseudanabaena sp. 'Roaring Creek' TaxID=1681830 RepID=UPI0006D82844|nr:glycosyltransferase family 2 protein [Pseudanabaena sp. 'Roaring Creek']
MKKISIVTPCYNEEKNVQDAYFRVKQVFSRLEKYSYEHLFIDNDSNDLTVIILKEIAKKDKNVKLIINHRNFGVVRSMYYALLQTTGDAVVFLAADLQEPPELIPEFIQKWEEGYQVVKGIKTSSKEIFLMYFLRSVYYYLVRAISDIKITSHFTGFGLYDKQVIEILREINDPYPYFRGLIEELGFSSFNIEYQQQQRKKGKSSYNLYRYFDEAMLGITSHSRIPLRIATIIGLIMSFFSLIVAIGYLIAKLMFWQSFPLGNAPVVVGLFLLSSIQLFFIGIIGEYIGLIHLRMLKRPLVLERERINFDNTSKSENDNCN